MADVPWESQDIGKRKLSAYSESYRKVLSSPEKLNIFFALRRQPHNNKDDKMRDPKTRLYRIINRKNIIIEKDSMYSIYKLSASRSRVASICVFYYQCSCSMKYL